MNEIGCLCPVGRIVATSQPAQSVELCCRRRLPRTGALLCWLGSDHIAASRGVDSIFPHPGERSLLLPNPATPAIHALKVLWVDRNTLNNISDPALQPSGMWVALPASHIVLSRNSDSLHGIVGPWQEPRSRGKLILGYTPFNTL